MRKRKSKIRKKGSVDRGETLDEFLAKDGLLAETIDAALKEISAEIAAGRTPRMKPE